MAGTKHIFMYTVTGIVMALLTLSRVSAASPDVPVRGDIFSLSLEELMQVEVISASRKAEKAFVTPDAIYVLTNDDIRRSGYRTIPDVLRMVPGVQVAQVDGNKFAVSVRGFNGRFANKLLVQIDGRTVYTQLHSGVYWENLDLVFEDIERIEVIRGPGATLWGANAVNGIINIITKSADKTKGLYAEGGYGDTQQGGVLRWGGGIGDAAAWRAYGKYTHRATQLDMDENEAYDAAAFSQGGFRCDWNMSANDAWTLQGDIYDGDLGQMYASTTGGVDNFDTHVRGFNTLVRYAHAFSPASHLSLQAYYDRAERNDIKLEEVSDIFDVDLQHAFTAVSGHDIMWGLGFRHWRERTRKTGLTDFVPDAPETVYISGFLQDRITLITDRLFLIPGVKVEHNDETGSECQPSGKLLWTPGDRHTLWLSVSRAVRTPSVYERSVDISVSTPFGEQVILKGNPDMDSEVLHAYEAGYRLWPARPLLISLAVFYNDYEKLQSLDMEGGTTVFRNDGAAETYGGEISLNWTPADTIRLVAWYAYLNGKVEDKLTGGKVDITDPEHYAHLRAMIQLPFNMAFQPAVYYVGAHRGNLDVPDYYRLDATFSWLPHDTVEVSVAGRNLLVFQNGSFVNAHQEYQMSRPENGLIERSVYGQVCFRW